VPTTSTKNSNDEIKEKKNNKSSPPTTKGVRFTKDEKRLREAGITLDIKLVIGLPMEEFNQLLSRQRFTEQQQELCRDVRKRGKNKWAAQNCRKRKIDQLEELSEKVEQAVDKRNHLMKNHEKLLSEYDHESRKLTHLIERVLNYHQKSPQLFHILVANDCVKITPRSEIKEEDIVPQPLEKYRLKFCPESKSGKEGAGAEHNTQQARDSFHRDQHRNENQPYQPSLLEHSDALVPSTSALPCSPDDIDEELRFFMH